MRALVTGGAGFIGSHLSERLLNEGYKVDVIDDLSTGDIDNIRSCVNNRNFSFIHDTVINEKMMYMLIERCNVIYHLAAAVGVDLIVKQPVRTIETNIRGTEVILEIAKKFGKKVVLASTSEVYGKSTKVPFSEDDDCIMGPTIFSRWSYATSKSVDEFLGLAYHEQFGLPVTILRFFNTVGPRQTGQYGMVIPRFIQAALKGKPIFVYGSGKQTRCFGYVSDILDGVIALSNEPKAEGKVFNIGATEEISIMDLAIKIKNLTNSISEINCVSYKEAYGRPFDDMERRVPNIEKISNLVGYKPKISLDELLQIIIDYFKENVDRGE